jgi:hypothetical protein
MRMRSIPRKAILALTIAGILLMAPANASVTSFLGVENRDFLTWLLTPIIEASMLIFITVFIAGILVGAGFTYLEYHTFKLSFDILGKAILVLLPLLAIAAMAATLALHKYNLFLLSLYMDVPMIGMPLLYVAYKKLISIKKRAVQETARKRL